MTRSQHAQSIAAARVGAAADAGRLLTRPQPALPRAAPTQQAAPALPGASLRVLNGAQAGSATLLPAGCFRIGRDLDNDVVLADPAIAPAHALLIVDARGARLRLLRSGRAGSRKRITPGTAMELQLGETMLRIEAHAAAPPRRRHALLLGGTAVLALGIACAALAAAALTPALHTPAVAARDPGAATAIPPVSGLPANAPLPGAAAALADRLAAAGLAEGISISASADALLARGTLPPEAMPAWRGVQEWYDAAHPQGPVLVREVREARLADRPRLQVQAVWTGPLPFLIAADGERYGEGAVVDGGWTIERIEPAHIVLSRAGRTIALAF